MPEAQLKKGEVGDIVYSLPVYSSHNASAYRSLLSGLDHNLEALQLGCYGISDTTLEEVRDTHTLRGISSYILYMCMHCIWISV